MKELIVDYIQSILSDVSYEVRSGRRLISLIGILGEGGGVPEDIQSEALKLGKFIVLRELFTALMEPISSLAKKRDLMPVDRQMAPSEIDFNQLLQQLNETRVQIAEYDAINYPLIISWVIAQAKAQKFLKNR